MFLQSLISIKLHNNKIFIATSICVEKCNASTDLLDVIKPTNLYVKTVSQTSIDSNNDIVEQLRSLKAVSYTHLTLPTKA